MQVQLKDIEADAIALSLTANGQILVERKFAGVTVDRYITPSMQQLPKRANVWMQRAAVICSQSSAEVAILETFPVECTIVDSHDDPIEGIAL